MANFLRRVFNSAGDDIPPLAPLSVWTAFTILQFEKKERNKQTKREERKKEKITHISETGSVSFSKFKGCRKTYSLGLVKALSNSDPV